MASPSPSLQQLLVTVRRALDCELDLWTPYVPAADQPGMADLRPRMITWLGRLTDKFGFSPETLFLAVDIFDRFLHLVRAQAKYVKCIAVTCFYLAAKSVEEDDVIPGTCELVRQTECGFSTSEVLRMELCILDKLRWDLRASHTSLEFIQLFHALVLTKCPSLALASPRGPSPRSLTAALLPCLSHAPLLLHAPSSLALAALSLCLERTWSHWLPATRTLQELTGLSNEELVECREAILRCRRPAEPFLALCTPSADMPPRLDQAPRPPLQPLSTPNGNGSTPTLAMGSRSKAVWNRLKVAPPSSLPLTLTLSPSLPITPPPSVPATPHLPATPPSSLPVTPHPPAKRRKVEQDDDAYDDIRSLYDSEASYVATGDYGATSGAGEGVVLSCASQVARFGGARVPTATQFAAG